MHVAATQESASDTKTNKPSRARVFAQISSARSRDSTWRLTSDAEKSASSEARSAWVAILAIGIADFRLLGGPYRLLTGMGTNLEHFSDVCTIISP
jgi:hypothetical protein